MLNLARSVRAERRSVERLARLPGRMAALVGAAEQLLDLDDDVVARAQPDPVDGHRHERPRLRRHGDAGLRPVAPGLDSRVNAEDERGAEHDDPQGENGALLARSLSQTVRRDRTQEDRECGRPERPEARQWMVPRHSADEVPADRKCGEQGPQRWQGGEKKACGALGFLPDREEPRHDGPGTVTPLPGRVNAAHEPFTPRLHREYELRARR